jgi:hypothetical protein
MSIHPQEIFIAAYIAIFLFGNMTVKATLICALVVVVSISVTQYGPNTQRRECVNINNGQRVDNPLSLPATAYPEVFTNPSISRGINSSSNLRSREAAKCCGCARGKCDNNNCRCYRVGVPCERGCHQGVESYECRNSYGVRRDIVG